MSLYPKEMVPLQIDLAIGDRSYLFGRSGTGGPVPEPMLDYSHPLKPSSCPGHSHGPAPWPRTKGAASATGLGIKGPASESCLDTPPSSGSQAIRASRHG